MAEKELWHIKPATGWTPQGAAFSEAAAWVRELNKQGRLNTPEDRMWAQQLTDRAYMATMLEQMLGASVGPPEELPEGLKFFPGATNSDGTVKFSSKSPIV